MPRLELPEDAVKIDSYGKHQLEGLYYSASMKSLYTKYKLVRKLSINGKRGFYSRKIEDGKSKSLYISLKKLFKQHEDIRDSVEWIQPEKTPRKEKLCDPRKSRAKKESNSHECENTDASQAGADASQAGDEK